MQNHCARKEGRGYLKKDPKRRKRHNQIHKELKTENKLNLKRNWQEGKRQNHAKKRIFEVFVHKLRFCWLITHKNGKFLQNLFIDEIPKKKFNQN